MRYKTRLGSTLLTVVSSCIPLSATVTKRHIRGIFHGLEAPFLDVGDINAHHPLWGSRKTDRRGRIWDNVINEVVICTLNDGSPTFLSKNLSVDVLDVSFCSRDVYKHLSWSTVLEARGSDHLPICMSYDRYAPRPQGIVVRISNWKEFRRMCVEGLQAEMSAGKTTEVIQGSLGRRLPM